MALILWLALVAAAGAQEAEPAEPVEPVQIQDDDEIVVYGPLVVREARSDLVRAVRDRGWEIKKRKRGDIIFKPPKAWMGKAVLKPDGSFDFTRPVVVPKSLDLVDNYGYQDFGAIDRDANTALVSEADLDSDATSGGQLGQSDLGRAAYVVTPRLGLYILPSRRLLDAVRLDLTAGVANEQQHYREVLERSTRE